MTSSPSQILIVGAGPTGLALACELARRQLPFRLIDAAARAWHASRGKGLQPRTLEILDDLGVIERILAGGCIPPPLRFHHPDGSYQDQHLYPSPEPKPDTPYGSPLLIPQWRVETILRERLAELGGRVEFGTAFEQLEQDPTGITATLLREGQRETVRVDWLVACDGGRSTVRKQLGVAFLGETLETHRMFVADVRASGIDREYWHAWRNDDGVVALAPLPATDTFQFQASLTPQMPTEPTLASLQQILASRSGRNDIRLLDASWMSYWRANVRMVERYRVGRALLAGDAAHVHTPAGGQGMNTGIQDAYNLGWKLAAVVHGADASLLDTYEQERMPVAASVLGLSTMLMERAAQATHRVPQRGTETFQLDIAYRDSGLAQDLREPPGKVRAGDRAPDAPGLRKGDGTCRVFDLLRGAHFSLLAFGDGWGDVIAALQAAFGAGLKAHVIGAAGWHDTEGHAATAYDIHGDSLLLVRPDGYIGFATKEKSPAAVHGYLANCLRRPDQVDATNLLAS